MPIQETELHVDGQRAYCLKPEGQPTGGVLYLPTNAGPDKINRKYATKLAEAGLTTVLWDPYPTLNETPAQEERSKLSAGVDDTWAVEGQSRWVTYMQEALGVEKFGCIGFCMGGRYSLLLGSRDRRLNALVSYYPTIRVPTPPHQKYAAVDVCGEIRCPVTLVCPGQDHITTPETYSALRNNLRKREEPTIAQMYPHAPHGFIQHGGSPEDVRLAWAQTTAFLQAALS
jgi:carboxymethylenebutenolidase